jgi:O-antigen/teichoic acid export membrane protein
VAQRFSTFFFGAVSYALLARAFGEDKGSMKAWGLYLIILSLFEMVKQGMLRNPTIKFLGLAEYKDKTKEVQSSALAINTAFSAIIVILLLFFAPGLSTELKSPELAEMLRWSVIMVLLLIPFNHYEVLLQAQFQFQKIFVAYVVRQGIFFSGVAILYFFYKDQFTLMNLVWLQIVALTVGVIILFILTSAYRLKGYHHDFAIMRQMFHFGKYVFGTNLFANIARSVDHFITSGTLDSESGKVYVSAYNVSARISNMMDVPALATADVLFPKNVQTLETEGLGKVKYYFERMIGTILAVIIPLTLFIFIFPKFVILIIAGPKYYDAALILQITIIANITRPLSYHYGSTLDAIGKPRVNFLSVTVQMIISLVLTYFFLLKFGGMGAAYATVVSNLVNLVIMVVILKKHIHLELRNIPKYIMATYKDILSLPGRLRKAKPGA